MERYLTTQQAAKILGVGTTTIKRWSDDNRLPAFKTAGGHRRYRVADVTRLRGHEGSEEISQMSQNQLDTLEQPILRLDHNCRVVQANRASEQIMSSAEGPLLGRAFFHELAPGLLNRTGSKVSMDIERDPHGYTWVSLRGCSNATH